MIGTRVAVAPGRHAVRVAEVAGTRAPRLLAALPAHADDPVARLTGLLGPAVEEIVLVYPPGRVTASVRAWLAAADTAAGWASAGVRRVAAPVAAVAGTEAHAVLDIGRTGAEATLVVAGRIVARRSSGIGGDRLDLAVRTLLTDASPDEARRLREVLSLLPEARHGPARIGLEQVRALLIPLLDEAVATLAEVMAVAPEPVAVLLTGGVARTPLLAERVDAAALGPQVRVAARPDLAAVLGALTLPPGVGPPEVGAPDVAGTSPRGSRPAGGGSRSAEQAGIRRAPAGAAPSPKAGRVPPRPAPPGPVRSGPLLPGPVPSGSLPRGPVPSGPGPPDPVPLGPVPPTPVPPTPVPSTPVPAGPEPSGSVPPTPEPSGPGGPEPVLPGEASLLAALPAPPPVRRIRSWAATAAVAVLVGGVAAGGTAAVLPLRPPVAAVVDVSAGVLVQYGYRLDVPAGWEHSGGLPERRRSLLTRVAAPDGTDLIAAERTPLGYDADAEPERAAAELRVAFDRSLAAGAPLSDYRSIQVAGRPVTTYRQQEHSGVVVDWFVVLDGGAQLSVGCRHTSAARTAVQAACAVVVGSIRPV